MSNIVFQPGRLKQQWRGTVETTLVPSLQQSQLKQH